MHPCFAIYQAHPSTERPQNPLRFRRTRVRDIPAIHQHNELMQWRNQDKAVHMMLTCAFNKCILNITLYYPHFNNVALF